MFTAVGRSFFSRASSLISGAPSHTIRSVKTQRAIIRKAEITHDVTLIGSAYSGLLALNDGTQQFYLKTRENDTNYTVHNIYVRNETLDNLGDPIVKGQQLIISGRLRTTRFQRHDNKPQDMYRILARTIYECQPYDFTNVMDDDQMVLDRNEVCFREQICFDIQHSEKFTSFTVAHHYPALGGAEATAFLSVFAYDDYLRDYIRHNLKRLDTVWLKGTLKYKPCMDDKGKRRYKGYIKADSITKVIPMLPSQTKDSA